jgi:putative FmdB family regulatory protein
MPLYEYRCLKCGVITEVLRPIKSRDNATNCGSCGATTERILSQFNKVAISTSQTPRITSNKHGSTAIRMEGGSATVRNCSFENFQTGISVAKGSKLNMDGNKFEKVDKPIEVTDE